MSARSHRLRQQVHHGRLELWLIMRLEGTETHTYRHTPLKVVMKGWTHSVTSKLRHRQRGLRYTHIFTQTHRDTNSTWRPGRSHEWQEHNVNVLHKQSPCGIRDTFNSQTHNREHGKHLRLWDHEPSETESQKRENIWVLDCWTCHISHWETYCLHSVILHLLVFFCSSLCKHSEIQSKTSFKNLYLAFLYCGFLLSVANIHSNTDIFISATLIYHQALMWTERARLDHA